jgi:hypothetical protein
LQFADLIANDVDIAQLADSSRNGVRNFIVGDERVNNGTSPVDSLARVRGQEDGLTGVCARHLAHIFECQIVSIDVQSFQGSS